MALTELTQEQQAFLEQPFESKLLLIGSAGSGKTTAAVERLKSLVGNGIPARSVLILVPQRSLAIPYVEAVQNAGFPAGGEPAVVTLGGLGQRMISLFWPMISKTSGFAKPNFPPQFLTLESAQYYMAQVIQPFLQKGYFENISIDPNRLYSQILDNINKAAVVGFPLGEIGERLKKAWSGEASRLITYDQAQECAVEFRKFCLKNNLLDYSLQFELFTGTLWKTLLCHEYLIRNYRHLIYDNIEEDVPVAHDLVSEWLPEMDSALLIRDTAGGFRSFLGADPDSAQNLGNLYEQIHFSRSLNQSEGIKSFQSALHYAIQDRKAPESDSSDWQDAFEVQSFRFYPEMMDWTVDRISLLLQQEVRPDEIAVLTPYLSDSLRFSLFNRFELKGIPVKTFRPSRSLKDEPVTRALLSLAKIAYPQWHMIPSKQDIRFALTQSIAGADLIRADLLAQTLYQPGKPDGPFAPFEQIRPEMQSRITFSIGERYERLRQWLIEFRSRQVNELDIFLSSIFGEILSQEGFDFHQNLEAAAVTARLVESALKFRRAVLVENVPLQIPIGKEYTNLLDRGLIAAQSVSSWRQQMQANAVLLTPAFTFLMSNRPVRYQFWLDVGSHGWWTRLDQPLTQPYVLSRQWDPSMRWSHDFEVVNNQKNLDRLVSGLLSRCREKVFLGISGMNEQGNEERGELVNAVQVLRRKMIAMGSKVEHV